jgi:hypothetical protein
MEIVQKVSDISFTTTSYVFTRIQALTWVANGTSLLNLLEKNACVLLSQIIDETPDNKVIVANFCGIVNIDDHAMDTIFRSLEDNSKQLIIINGHNLLDKITLAKKTSKAIITSDGEHEIITIGKNTPVNDKEIYQEREKFVDRFLKNTVANTFRKFPYETRLSSTPVIANGEFDSNYIISNPSTFMWVTLFLSDKLNALIDEAKFMNVKLLSASLRGAPFAAMLGLINNLKFETIDHFGPKHKVLDIDFVKIIEKGINYIYIGDYVIGGTEIKIAKTYTEMKNSKLEYALAIGSLFDKSVFNSMFELHYLVSLKEASSEVNFKLF